MGTVGCLDRIECMRIVHADAETFNALGQAMLRVEALRIKLSRAKATDLFPEFMMRRAILRGRLAISQRNTPEALRMLTVLTRIGDGAAC
jgi:hypothetical protein